MKMVVGIVRTTCLKKVLKELDDIGIRNLTVSKIEGIGEQITLRKSYAVHDMIQIIVPDEKVNQVTDVILQHAHSGLAGDGIITVIPIDYMIRLRTKERLE